jgi:1-acyl-sn-glycerol-3-phosphate acyltransferase
VGVPVLPVAHNAGRYWPKNGFRKYPGEIVVRIGPPIQTAGRKATQVMAESEAWIKQAMLDL